MKCPAIPFKRLVIWLSISFCAAHSFAQDEPARNDDSAHAISGAVTDPDSTLKMGNSTIIVLRAEDSLLVKFTYAKAGGLFSIGGLPTGKFILLVTFPAYADYVEAFSLDSAKPNYDFGSIKIIPKAKLLEAVIVKGRISSIKLKGDTTEYNASAFKLPPNAKVEDLLKKLPGIQVDNQGRITTQGQAVNKVLVDGEEFFGDDPTLVTRNIRADMVDKVQIYDKKSDQAVLTGIDDGQREKTINIKIKEDRKYGYFGKLSAGAGTDGYYTGEELFNSFKGNRKLSVYGIAGNDGKTGLGWMDNAKYASSTVDMPEPGVIVDLGGGDELETFDGKYNGQGIPLARNGGLHYDDKWNGDKESLNMNYKIGSLSVDGTSTSSTENNLPGEAIFENSSQVFHNQMFRQKFDATDQIRLDSTSDLKFMINGTIKNTESDNSFASADSNAQDVLLNRQIRNTDNNGNLQLFNAQAFYEKKFRKPGRAFSVNVEETSGDNSIKGYLYSQINFYDMAGGIDSTQLIDEYKTDQITNFELRSSMTYSEPLSNTFSAVVNYGIGTGNNSSVRNSFDSSASEKYDLLDSLFSNSFRVKQFYNEFGAFLNYGKGKSVLNFGSKVSLVDFTQVNRNTDNVFKENFVNWYPQVSWRYQFSEQAFLRFNYSGSARNPTVEQLQPVLVNNDPLNIILGNQNLTPSFVNQFNVVYQSFNPANNQLIGVFGNYSLTTNPIVSSLTTDSTGKSLNQTVNLPGSNLSHIGLSAFYDRKIKPLDMDLGINFNIDGSTQYCVSNNEVDKIGFNTYAVHVRGTKSVQNRYDLNFSLGPSYTVSGSSLQPGINNNGSGFDANGGINLYLPGKFQVSSDVNYQFNGKTETFNENFSRTLVNAAISRTFLKQDNLKLSLSGNDLLNQNVGFNRSTNGYLIIQNNYSTIRRYFMISVIFDFNKEGKKEQKK